MLTLDQLSVLCMCFMQPTQPRVSPRLLRAMSAGVAARSASRRSKSGRNVKEPGLLLEMHFTYKILHYSVELGDMVVINTEVCMLFTFISHDIYYYVASCQDCSSPRFKNCSVTNECYFFY